MQNKNLNDHLAPPKMLPRSPRDADTPGWEPRVRLYRSVQKHQKMTC